MPKWTGQPYVVFNPHDKPVEELPVIWGFNNGGPPGWMSAVLIADDGELLGGHVCSGEGFMYGDLGIIKGHRSDRHETFREHYPDGYRMDFVPYDEVKTHEGLKAALEKHRIANSAPAPGEPAVVQ